LFACSNANTFPEIAMTIDPTTTYPQAALRQADPIVSGPACQINPRQFHGETSHIGSGCLAGRRVLIVGGDSGMGRGAAIAYAREGADVAINYLPDDEADAQKVIVLIEFPHLTALRQISLPPDRPSGAVVA
jgi:hypothetical protein